MTQVGYWCRAGFPVYEPRTFLAAGYQGTLGFELPTGLGAQVARPARRVVVIAAVEPEGLGRALLEGLSHPRPTLIEVPVGEMDDPWPLLMRMTTT